MTRFTNGALCMSLFGLIGILLGSGCESTQSQASLGAQTEMSPKVASVPQEVETDQAATEQVTIQAAPSYEDDPAAWTKANYTKREYMIPMRDGISLFTAVYVPNDDSQPWPFMMKRTPYSCRPYGEDAYSRSPGPEAQFVKDKFIFVHQDVRGCYLSEGTFVNMTPHVPEKLSTSDIDESSDTYDTVEWLLENIANHNGKVGQWGISYPGFYCASSMIDAHPALIAVSPQAPIADWWYDDFHHHGAFFLPHCFGFISGFGLPRPEPTTSRARRTWEYGTPDGYEFYLNMTPLTKGNENYLKGGIDFWNQTLEHPNYDEFWQSRNILPHLNNVAPAVMTVGGWYDAEDLYGPLKIYRSVEAKNPDVFNVLVMGPWAHGGWARGAGDRLGNVEFGGKQSEFYRENIQRPFFYHFLRDEGANDLPEAYVFETGANEWRTFEAWPPANVVERSLYMNADRSLTWDAPSSDDEGAFDEYISDPKTPVPFTETISMRMTRPYMTDDQRFAGRRPDVMTYRTEVLTEDVTLAGPLLADLWVSTSGTASDWVVKIIDVYPSDRDSFEDREAWQAQAGYQQMVRSEVIRGRFRNSHEHPEPFVAGEPTYVDLELQDVFHTFKKGHAIMVQIQSTWFPLVDINPHHYAPNVFKAQESDFIKATQRVYRGGEHATRIRVQVLED
ncbi:MAG: CocE/NonD family hydrolase [Planctomycetota bacterium]|nr:CocE/NonD family hydrolase [Planctomycetota bacterium]